MCIKITLIMALLAYQSVQKQSPATETPEFNNQAYWEKCALPKRSRFGWGHSVDSES